jgi:hypothetical protein
LVSSDIDIPTVRRAAVVHSLGTTGKTVDNWLQRDQVTLPSGSTPRGNWRGFTGADVAVLSIVKELVRFGLPVAVASGFANTALADAAADRLSNFSIAPPDSIAALGDGLKLLVWRKGQEWRARVDREHEAAALPANTYLVVRLHVLLPSAISRAFRMNAVLDKLEERSARSTKKFKRRRPMCPKAD